LGAMAESLAEAMRSTLASSQAGTLSDREKKRLREMALTERMERQQGA
jgi:hypothetical protein